MKDKKHFIGATNCRRYIIDHGLWDDFMEYRNRAVDKFYSSWDISLNYLMIDYVMAKIQMHDFDVDWWREDQNEKTD